MNPPAPFPITRALGEWIAGARYALMPPEAIAIARISFIDCVGVTLAGRRDVAPQTLLDTLEPADGDALVLFGARRASAPDAAWINGTAAHALDFDDVALRGHPSAVLVPAILAEGQALNASGERMLAAWVIGYETWAELIYRDHDQHSLKGWHPTAVFGPVAAAAACAALRGLDPRKTAHAIALAASHAGGLMANFGTMTKPYHAGRAAHAGVLSARLAAKGFTAADDALEHPRGFLAALSPAGHVDLARPLSAGAPWQVLRHGMSLKKYPSCYCTHKPLDGLLALRAAHDLQPAQVASIAVSMSQRNALTLRHHQPRTGLQGKFSIEFAMAGALVAGRLGLAEHTDAFVQSAPVQALFERVSVQIDPLEDPVTGHAVADRVVVRTLDGRTLDSGPVAEPRGSYALPLTADEVAAKFLDCAREGGAGERAEALLTTLGALAGQPDAGWIQPVVD
ncbi:MAG: MmgE/PrpD family protein [Burkholderiaceae bacterium]|nr:MmgE/PrpD family protein [Burkholderiaceae bacterium]